MKNIFRFIALGATVSLMVLSGAVWGQDDLDALLKDLEKEDQKAEAKAEVKAEEPKAEIAEKAEEKVEEAKVEAEEKTEEKVEEKVEEAKAEEKVESKEEVAEEKPEEKAEAKEETKAEAEVAEKTEEKAEVKEAVAEEKPAEKVEVTTKQADDVLSLLDALAKEGNVKGAAATAEVKAEPKEEAKAEEKAEAKAEVAEKAETKQNLVPAGDSELIANITATEKLRRQALDEQAKREILAAREAMDDEEYSDAVRHYGLALKLINDRPASKKLQRECSQGIAEGLYRAACQEYELGRRERAFEIMNKAVDIRHPKAKKTLAKWNAENDGDLKAGEVANGHRMDEADYQEERTQIRKHLKRCRQYLALRDMKHALEECEVVLVNDPYNQEAIRMRRAIQKKRATILKQERESARDGMIADVDEAWRPVYAVNAAQLAESSAETIKQQAGEDPERTMEQDIERRMKEMRLPTISFKPPATIIDAVEFFRQASKDYDRPDIPLEKRGFNFVLRTPQGAIKNQAPAEEEESDDFSSNGKSEDGSQPTNGLEPIQTITASDITFYEALKLVCDSVNYKFIVRGPVVMIMPMDMSTAEILPRTYNVPEAFMERVTTASSEMKEMGGFGNSSKKSSKSDSEEESPDRDWKAFFEEMGVKWPDGSSIKHVKSLGKLYVRNTRENLAEFEKVLDELGGQPMLIEIETRFVEVSQDDLNSLGFEWILNSDYSLNVGDSLGKALGINSGTFGTESGSSSIANTGTSKSTLMSSGKWSTLSSGTVSESTTYNRSVPISSNGGTWISNEGGERNIGVNAFGGTSDYGNGNRYLSTVGNHISGESQSTNDQFMRVNAFLGDADLSMILHMLSQRSDTDLLSAPKVVTKSGENAIIKVVTEYIYPQDYDVQLQSSGGSSGGSSGSSGGSSAILAVVEPQNFTMREVGVILDVTPQYNEANGGTIDLELKPQVVDEPVWHNYGMKIPFSGNSSLQSFEGLAEIPTKAVEAITALGGTLSDDQLQSYQNAIMTSSMSAMASSSGSGNMTWYDAPMEQPWFHVRSIDSKVSITPGSTVVMGGLITESRKAMDDKVPFLGDIPYIGRLFRSHAEQTSKRNLLIFVTGRLITPSGRELHTNPESQNADKGEVKAAPSAE